MISQADSLKAAVKASKEKDILTYSNISMYLTCPRKFKYRIQDYLVPIDRDETALRIGSNYHDLLERLYKKESVVDILDHLESVYSLRESAPDMVQEFCRLKAMFLAYTSHYAGQDNFKVLGVEENITGPIKNPDSAGTSQSFTFKGKVDGLIQDAEGRCLFEHKTTAKLDSGYIKRVVSFDIQIALYAHFLGVDRVLYNVIQKPSIRFRKNDTEELYVERLLEWYEEHPGCFFREEITITPEDKRQALKTLWSVSQKILLDRRADYFVQSPGNCQKFNRFCEYYELCCSKDNPIVKDNSYKIKKPNSELNSEPVF